MESFGEVIVNPRRVASEVSSSCWARYRSREHTAAVLGCRQGPPSLALGLARPADQAD